MTLTTTTNKFLLGKLVLCCQVGPGPASQLSSATGQSLQSHLATRSPERAQSHNTTSSCMRSEGDSGDTVTQAPCHQRQITDVQLLRASELSSGCIFQSEVNDCPGPARSWRMKGWDKKNPGKQSIYLQSFALFKDSSQIF